MKISASQLATAGILGAVAIVLSVTPIGLIPVPNVSGAATTVHIPAIIAGIIAGPLVGALVGLVLAFASWYRFSAAFVQFAAGSVPIALAAAFLPRLLIGVVAHWTYRALGQSRWASAVAALLGTTANTVGVLGILYAFGSVEFRALVPIILTNYPFEVVFAVVVTVPVVALLARRPGARPVRA